MSQLWPAWTLDVQLPYELLLEQCPAALAETTQHDEQLPEHAAGRIQATIPAESSTSSAALSAAPAFADHASCAQDYYLSRTKQSKPW